MKIDKGEFGLFYNMLFLILLVVFFLMGFYIGLNAEENKAMLIQKVYDNGRL